MDSEQAAMGIEQEGQEQLIDVTTYWLMMPNVAPS
jgi:hypothetical protein